MLFHTKLYTKNSGVFTTDESQAPDPHETYDAPILFFRYHFPSAATRIMAIINLILDRLKYVF